MKKTGYLLLALAALLLCAGCEVGGNVSPEPAATPEIWPTAEAVSLSEAQTRFGRPLLLPAYLPPGFVLSKISYTPKRDQTVYMVYKAAQLSITIQQIRGSFYTMQPREAERKRATEITGFVKLGGKSAVVVTYTWSDAPSASYTSWMYSNDLNLLVYGEVSRDELLKVATSLAEQK